MGQKVATGDFDRRTLRIACQINLKGDCGVSNPFDLICGFSTEQRGPYASLSVSARPP